MLAIGVVLVFLGLVLVNGYGTEGSEVNNVADWVGVFCGIIGSGLAFVGLVVWLWRVAP